MTDNSAAIQAANDAIDAAYTALALRKATAAANPTAANKAAVTALEQRVATDQARLAALMQALPRPVFPSTTPPAAPPAAPVLFSPIPLPGPIGPGSGVISVTPTSQPTTTTTTPPELIFPGPKGGGLVTTKPPDLSTLDAPITLAAGIVGSPAARAAAEGWDYWRNIVSGDFADAEYLFNDIAGSVLDGGTAVVFGEVAVEVSADVASIEVVGFAAVLLLSEYAFGWLLRQVASYFPNPSIFGWHPLNFIVSGINYMGKQFETSAQGLGLDIAHVLVYPWRQLLGLFQRSGNATAAAHNKVATLHNETIPQARHDAVVSANTYTDSVVHTFTTQLDAAITKMHQDTARAIADAKAAIESSTAQALARVDHDLVVQLAGDENTLALLVNTINTAIPVEIATAVNNATAAENQKLAAASSQIQAEIDAVQGQISTLTSQVARDTTTISVAQANVATLQSATSVDEAAIEAQRQIIANAQIDIATSTTTIADLNNKITSISDTLGPVHAAQLLNTTQLSPFEGIGMVALPVAVGLLASEITKIKTKIDTCLVETCDPVSPRNIKNVLMGLLGALSAAGELAFIAEAITNPLGTANVLAPTLDTIDAGAVATLNALLSL